MNVISLGGMLLGEGAVSQGLLPGGTFQVPLQLLRPPFPFIVEDLLYTPAPFLRVETMPSPSAPSVYVECDPMLPGLMLVSLSAESHTPAPLTVTAASTGLSAAPITVHIEQTEDLPMPILVIALPTEE